MKRMIVFTKPDGFRFAVAAFEVRRVYQLPTPVECRIVYQVSQDEVYLETSEIVVGTFDDIMARIEESNK